VTLFRLIVQNGGGFQWDRIEVDGSEATDGAAVVAFAVVVDGGEKEDGAFVDDLFAGGFVGLLAGVEVLVGVGVDHLNKVLADHERDIQNPGGLAAGPICQRSLCFEDGVDDGFAACVSAKRVEHFGEVTAMVDEAKLDEETWLEVHDGKGAVLGVAFCFWASVDRS